MDKAKEKIPKQCRIGDTCFTSLYTTNSVNLFTINPKNLNNVQRDSKNLRLVIMILGTDVHGGKTIFYDGEKWNEFGKIAHVLKHSHVMRVVGVFDKILHEGSIWTGRTSVLSLIFTNQYFFTFYIMLQHFMTYIYNQMIKRNILIITGVVFFRKKS